MTGYGSLKVADLKALLKERSLSQSGRKTELISRLEEADSKNDGAAEQVIPAAGSADDEAAQQRSAVQPQEHKENGDVDGANQKPSAATGEGDSIHIDSVNVDTGTTAEGIDGKHAEEQAGIANPSVNDEVNAGNADVETAGAPEEGEKDVPGGGSAHDSEHRQDGMPRTADAQRRPDSTPAGVIDKNSAPLEQGDGDAAALPAKADDVTANLAEQPEDSDSLGLDDSDLDQEPKADAQAAGDSGRNEQNSVRQAEEKAAHARDPPAKTDDMSADDFPATARPAACRPGDGQDAAAAPAPVAKRKHAAIVFPDAATQADRPAPTKREKVELVVPEATDETRALCISGLKRPLREGDLKEILSKTGAVEGFWIDSCKTHCYVVYGTVEEAKATRDAVDGLQWPPRCRSVMQPKFVAVEEAQGMIDSKGAATLTRVPSTSAPAGADVKGGEAEGQADDKNGAHADAAEPVIDLTKAAPRVPRRDASQIAAGGSAPPELAPSELFNLTQATPSLYWLPLSEEQVEQRRSVDAARHARAAVAAASAETGADTAAGNGDKASHGGTGDGAGGGSISDAVPVDEQGRDQDVEMVDAEEEKGPGEE